MPVSESDRSSAELVAAPTTALPRPVQTDSSGSSDRKAGSKCDDTDSEKESDVSREDRSSGRVKHAVEQVEHKQQQRQASTSTATSFKIGVQSHARDPKLLFAAARDVVRASLSPRSKASKAANTANVGSPKGYEAAVAPIRTAFGKFRRSSTLASAKASTRALSNGGAQPEQPVDTTNSAGSVQQRQPNGPNEPPSSNFPTSAPLAKSRSPVALKIDTSCSQPVGDDSVGRGFVDEVRRTLDELVLLLDSVDPRKLVAIRLGGELRGLLGKAQDEFCAYEAAFAEHAGHVGVSIALQNFAASLHQVFGLATRLQAAKFLLNKTFKREVTFAFQEINSYYTSLFMELSMAVARRSGIELPLPSPVKLQPPSPVAESAMVTTAETSVQTDDQPPPGNKS